MVTQFEILLPEYPRGCYLITDIITRNLKKLPNIGLINICLQHTSAALTINENADSSVRKDMHYFFNQLVVENNPNFTHCTEGSDDMPAHIKSSILGQTITLPITNNRINLGTWQGIYLCEFRNKGGCRKLIVSIFD